MTGRSTRVVSVLLALALSSACIVDDNPAKLTHEVHTLERTDGPSSVVLEYPEFRTASRSDTADNLNAAVAEMLLGPVFRDSPGESPAALADRFLSEWSKARAELPDSASTQAWNLDRHIRVIFEGPGALTLAFEETVFTGGAHGMQLKHYASFDPLGGKRLELSDVVNSRHESRLATLAEKRFRETRGLSPDADLTEAGFAFNQRSIVPADNFGVVEAGIVFRFNPYEIGPYALGPTEFTVTRKELLQH